jgi:hypothetical protein
MIDYYILNQYKKGEKTFIRIVYHLLLLRCGITYNRPLYPIYRNTNTNAAIRITNNYFEMEFLLQYFYASTILASIIAITTMGIILIFQSIPLIGLGIALTIHSVLLLYSKILSSYVLELLI